MTSHSSGDDGVAEPTAATASYNPPRRGLPVAGLCLLCAILAATVALVAAAVWLGRIAGSPDDSWTGPGDDETAAAPPATALLQVDSRKPAILFEDTAPVDPDEYDALRRTQRQLLKSDFVIGVALRDPTISKLDLQQRHGDATEWLANRLEVTFPDNSEIMQVGLPGLPPSEAAPIVNALVGAYLTEIVEKEKNKKRTRLNELDSAYAVKDEEIRKRLTNLKNLAEELGTSASGGLDLNQQIALEEYRDSRRQLLQVRSEASQISVDLKVQQAALEVVDTLEITDAEVATFVASDPIIGQVLYEIVGQFQQRLADLEVVATPEAGTQLAAKLRRDMAMVESLIESRRQRLREQLRESKRADIGAELRLLKARAAALAEGELEIAKNVAQKRHAIVRLSETSVDLDMMRAEVRQLKEILYQIGIQRERLSIELRAPSRIRLRQQAEVQ